MGIYDRALFTGMKHAAPIYRNYIDILAGKHGKLKSMLGWGATIEGGLLAADKLYPTKTIEPISKIGETYIVDKPKPEKIPSSKKITIDDEVVNDPNNSSNKDYTDETFQFEDNQSGEDDVSKGESTTNASSDPNLIINNDSLTRIKQYKDTMQQLLGQAGGDRMQSSALLMQLGAALMAGETRNPGVSGFFEVVGKAAAQTAPMLFQIGAEKQKADRELTTAAMELYFKEKEADARSGPYVWVYKNNYAMNKDGSFQRDDNGNFITAGPPTKIRQVKRTSPEEEYYYNLNNKLGYDAFSFVEDPGGTEGYSMMPGIEGAATFGKELSAAAAAQRSYAKYTQRGLKEMAEYIMPTIINNQHLIGVEGEVGRKFGPLAELVQQAADDGKFDERYKGFVSDIVNNKYGDFTVYESNGTIEWGGERIPVFIDKKNKYGQNDLRYNVEGDIMSEAGDPKVYFTKDSLERILLDPNRSALETFETTIGLMLARNRQPTGRMLADVLRRSFADTSLTGILGRSNSPKQVINNYMKIYMQLHNDMMRAMESSGLTNNKELASKRSDLQYAPDEFGYANMGDFENAYYDLRNRDAANYSVVPDIPGGQSYVDWKHKTKGNIQQDYNEDMVESNSITNKWADIFGVDISVLE